MSDDIALVLIKRIEALEAQVAALKAAKPEPLVWPPIDLGPVTGTGTA